MSGSFSTHAVPVFEPDRDGLGRWLRERVDDETLWQIAESDYGYALEWVYEKLKRFIDSGALPDRTSEMRECCELSSHDPDMILKGMLSAYVLATFDDFWRFVAVWDRLGCLAHGAMLSGETASLHAARFLCWLSLRSPPDVPKAHLHLAVLLLDARWKLSGDASLREQADRVCCVADQELESELALGCDSARWILALDEYQSDEWWKKMTRQVLECPTAAEIPEVGALCRRIAALSS